MSGRVTLIGVVVASLIGLYVFAIDRPRLLDEQRRAIEQRQLLRLSSEDIRELELPLNGLESRARLRRVGETNDWELLQPIEGAADPAAVEGILAALVGLRARLEVEPSSEELPGFELDEQRAVSLVPASGDAIRLVIGGESPVDALRYVALSRRPGAVFGVRGLDLDTLTPELFHLRSKLVRRVDPRDVRRLAIEVDGELRAAFDFDPARADEAPRDDARLAGEQSWRMREPFDAAADAIRIGQLLQKLYFLKATEIVDPPVDLTRYGLAEPVRSVQIEAADGTRTRYAFGRVEASPADSESEPQGAEGSPQAAGAAELYVQVDDTDTVYRVASEFLSEIPESLFAYRFKRVLSLRLQDVTALRLRFPRDGVDYRMTTGSEGWSLAPAPDLPRVDAEAEVATGAVDTAVQLGEFLEAEGLHEPSGAAAVGLAPARLRVEFLGADDRLLGWLELGDEAPAGGVYARSSSLPDPAPYLWIVGESVRAAFPLGVEAFRTQWLRRPGSAEGAEESLPAEGSDPAMPES